MAVGAVWQWLWKNLSYFREKNVYEDEDRKDHSEVATPDMQIEKTLKRKHINRGSTRKRQKVLQIEDPKPYSYDYIIHEYLKKVERGYVFPIELGMGSEATKYNILEAIEELQEELQQIYTQRYESEQIKAKKQNKQMECMMRKACASGYEQERLMRHKEIEESKYDAPINDSQLTQQDLIKCSAPLSFNETKKSQPITQDAIRHLTGQQNCRKGSTIFAPSCRKIDIFSLENSDDDDTDSDDLDDTTDDESSAKDESRPYRKITDTVLALSELKRSIEFYEEDSMRQYFKCT